MSSPSHSNFLSIVSQRWGCFFLMFTTCLLLNFNFTIMRGLRNTLTVVDLGSGAHFIPLFELFGAMPGAFIMTTVLARLMNYFSLQKIFSFTLAFFLCFFLFFTFIIYPYLSILKQSGTLNPFIAPVFAMLFYTVCELWKPALVVILFFGLLNFYIPSREAKKIYAPLMLGGSLGSILAGPIITFCNSTVSLQWIELSRKPWEQGLYLLVLIIVFVGLIAGVLFYFLSKLLNRQFANYKKMNTVSNQISIRDCVFECSQSPILRLMAWIVISDYIAYSLGEVLFLEILKIRYPDPHLYCGYMGYLAFWSGIITFFSSLLITPYILQRFRWVYAAMVTPICFLITASLFFISLRGRVIIQDWFGWIDSEWLALVVFLGSLQYCLCRASKYTFFDSSKEIAYILIPQSLRMRGKLVVDGLCARLGRGGASLLNLSLIQWSGGVLASSMVSTFIATAMALSWLLCTKRLGRLLDLPTKTTTDKVDDSD